MIKKRTKYTDSAYIINPITKRKIKVGSATYKKLVKDKVVKPVKIFVDDIDGDEYEEAPKVKKIVHKNAKKEKPLTKKYKMVMKKDDLGIKVATKKKLKKNVYETTETEHEEDTTESEKELTYDEDDDEDDDE